MVTHRSRGAPSPPPDLTEVAARIREVAGTRRDDRTATFAFEVVSGIDLDSIATGDGTEPSLAALLGTPVEVAEVAVVSVEGREGPFEDPTYLLEREEHERRGD